MKAIVGEENTPETVADRGGPRGWEEVTAEAGGRKKEAWVLVTETQPSGIQSPERQCLSIRL